MAVVDSEGRAEGAMAVCTVAALAERAAADALAEAAEGAAILAAGSPVVVAEAGARSAAKLGAELPGVATMVAALTVMGALEEATSAEAYLAGSVVGRMVA